MKSLSESKQLRGCGVYVEDGNGRYLLTQRGPEARHEPFKWEGPGGQVEKGESFEQGARREFEEELGIEVELGEIIAEFDEVIDANQTSWEAKIFSGSINGTPVIQEPTKCVGFGWFTREEIVELARHGLLATYSVKDFQKLGWL